MPTYIPVYQKKTDPVTGDTLYDDSGFEIMELVKTIEVPDEPIYDNLGEVFLSDEELKEITQ